MTAEELKAMSPAFRAGHHDGYRNIPVTPIPNGARENISDYWWGYHTGRKERNAHTQLTLKT